MEHTTDPKSAALSFLKDNCVGAVSTLSEAGTPRVRLVYYAADDSFSVYFLSLGNTRKVTDIRADSRAAFVVAGPDAHHTLQMEGTFEEITDTATFGPILSDLTKHLFPEGEESSPLDHLASAKPVIFKFSPTWIRWGDFTHPSRSEEAFTEISVA
jgi:general stress protein 26